MMAKYKRLHVLTPLLSAALCSAWLFPVCASADESGAASAEAPAATAPQPQAEGVAPQMSGQAASAPAGAAAPAAGIDATAPPASLTPMQAEIAQVLASERATVAQLQERLVAAKGTAPALELHKQVQDTKLQAQLTILRIQVRYARAEGRELVAEQLETAIRDMTTPKAPGKPIDRPAPTQAPASGAQQH
jgi:hypothetical protein